MKNRETHEDLLNLLNFYDGKLVDDFFKLRNFILSVFPESNELIYHTHALTTVFTPTLKLGDAFCHIPIYTNHLNLGFNKGTLLKDPHDLLKGTGKLIRHIPIGSEKDFKNKQVKELIREAIALTIEDIDKNKIEIGKTVSKIKK